METRTADAAVLEVERFEWAGPDRIEIVGYWSGLRGRRFMRPTLVLRGEEAESKRLLAVLDHKPWAADDGEEWVAAFPWDGDIVKFDSAEMNVGSGIDLDLPAPRMRPGKPRRFRQRVVARDASRDAAAAAPALANGIVSDTPRKQADTPAKATSTAKQPDAPAKATSTAKQADAPAKTASSAKPAERSKASATTPTTTKALATPVEQEPTQALPAETAPDRAAELTEQLTAKTAEADRLRTQRDDLRKERDQALEKLRTVRGELETERQSREKAVADARAEERESANRMLGEGAELRAAVERQREIAYLERDDANNKRDKAIEQRDKACHERDAAQAEAKEARHERKEALAQRDRAVKLAERADKARDQALLERQEAVDARDDAVREHDEIKRAYERGLPVTPPKPRFLPEEHERRSELDVWAPRASALGVLLLCAFIVLRLFACG